MNVTSGLEINVYSLIVGCRSQYMLIRLIVFCIQIDYILCNFFFFLAHGDLLIIAFNHSSGFVSFSFISLIYVVFYILGLFH